MKTKIESIKYEDEDNKSYLKVDLDHSQSFECVILSVGEVYISEEDAERLARLLLGCVKQSRKIRKEKTRDNMRYLSG